MIFDFDIYKRVVEEKKQIVTVFMLTHNRENYLRLAIDSMLDQTYTNFCLIVLDNCSTDDTKNAVLSYKDERVFYLYRESSKNYNNTEFARDSCLTKFFIVLHDDDVLQRDYLKTVVEEIEKNSYSAVSVGFSNINEKGELTFQPKFSGNHYVFTKDMYFSSFLKCEKNKGMVYPATIYRLDFYKKFPNFGGNIKIGPAGDQYIWFETERQGGSLCIIDEDLIHYRRHRKQDSTINAGLMEIQLLNYLLSIDYYKSKIFDMHWQFKKKIWRVYRSLLRSYSRNNVDSEKYHNQLQSCCLESLKTDLFGLIEYKIIWVIYYFRKPLSVVIRLLKGV